MTEASHFLKQFKNVSKLEYNGEILYNVLMEKYDKLKVNNLTFETLDPKNIIAKLYTSGFDEEYKNKIIVMINHSITQTDTCLYQNIINRIVNDKNISTCFDELDEDEVEVEVEVEVDTTLIETLNNYAENSSHPPSVNFKIKINLENNVNLNGKLDKYIKSHQTKDNTDEIIKKKDFLNNKKEEKEDMEIERKKEREIKRKNEREIERKNEREIERKNEKKRDKTQKLKMRQPMTLSISQKNYKSLLQLD